MLVWLNGKLIERGQAKVSAFDAGLQHGVGLFETIAAVNGVCFRASAHMERLAASARELRLSERLRVEPLAEALSLIVQRSGLSRARVRLTMTGGDLNLLQSEGRSQVDPTILIVAQPPTQYPEAMFEQGVIVTIADSRANPFDPMAGHKTLNYWPRIAALQQAAAKRAGEALWFSVSNHLTSGCVSNVFLVKDGRLLTPIARGEEQEVGGAGAIRAAVLPGITRAAMIELADGFDVECERRMLDINEVLHADELFLTNSSWGVLPVVGVEREKIGAGAVGELTRRLRAAWLALVEQETSAERM